MTVSVSCSALHRRSDCDYSADCLIGFIDDWFRSAVVSQPSLGLLPLRHHRTHTYYSYHHDDAGTILRRSYEYSG